MTVNENISLLQGLVRGYDNNLQFGNQFLYTLLIDSRSDIISRKLDSFQHISRHSFQKFCMALEEKDIHVCGSCVPDDLTCTAYITKYPIPEVISGKIRDYLDVMTMDNKIVDLIREEDANIIMMDDYKKRKPFYSIINGYGVLFNSKIKTGLQFRGLWYNPMDWIGKQLCNTPTSCIEASTMQLFMPTGLRVTIFNRVLERLQIPLKLTEQDIQAIEKNLAV
jgi:hypothetical protein